MAKGPSRARESENIRQLSAFRGYWTDSSAYPPENFGNDRVHMPVEVAYEWAGGRSQMVFNSELWAFVGSGPEDGTIDIDDTPKVKIEDFHLRFIPAFQIYKYDEVDHTLIISDSSVKMGGRYQVVIRPTIEEP